MKFESNKSNNSRANTDVVQVEPRHFKSKEGAVWLNMFETISNKYCLSQTKQSRAIH